MLYKVILKILKAKRFNVVMLCYNLCLSRLLHNGVANNVAVRLISSCVIL
jgi:hypothetical protein